MYSDYKNYIIHIRDNLIQCGVNISKGLSYNFDDYYTLFKVCIKLEDILLFYKILAVTGSNSMLKKFFLPLNVTYKNEIRNSCYNEFISNILPNYKFLTGDDVIPLNNELDELFNSMFDFDDDSGGNIESNVENIDLNTEEYSYVPNGVYLEDILTVSNNIKSEDVIEVFNGIYLEDLESAKSNDITYEELLSTEKGSNVVYKDHGVYLEDLIKSGEYVYFLDTESSEGSNWGYEEDEDDGVNYSSTEEDEGFNYALSEEEAEGVNYSLSENDDKDFNYTLDEEDEGANYASSDEDEDEESDYALSDEDEGEGYAESDDVVESAYYTGTDKDVVVSNNDSLNERDLGDSLQDITNVVLTNIKKGIINIIK